MYKYIFLDLDGTIVDSGDGIINSVVYALNKFGISVEDRSALRKFIGPPLKASFKDFYGFSDADAELAVKYYREYYSVTGIFECEIYDGIRELIMKLKDAGKKIILATSKPEHYARIILEHFSLDTYFHYISGLGMNDLKSEKADIIRHALEEMKIIDVSQAVMVGDRKHDIIGAHTMNMDCIAVLFGFGNIEEFREYKADYIAADTKQILDICMN